jgi:hypothetical protein
MSSWQAQRAMEREEDQLLKDLNEGRISQQAYNAAMRDLHREYNDAANDAAKDAYDRERDQW